ncbi:MAG: LytTR family DNA-binding domain-containing protein [Chitinophagales bacterium]|nr:LytTR family transcriptional regulator [Bacteroidota bacterium]MCB9044225.1 LytTR family transcriptional regulator [Chitinophagales bacterium]
MNLININLQEKEFQLIDNNIRHSVWTDTFNDISFVLVIIKDLLEDSRWTLRKAVNKYEGAHFIILSSRESVAKFAWNIGVFHFLSYPLDLEQLKLLKIKINKEFYYRKDIEKLKLSFQGGFHLIHPNEISVIQGQGNYCKFFLKNHPPSLYTIRIGNIAELLSAFPYMARIHKSLIINVNHLSQIKSNNAYFRGKPTVILKLSSKTVIAIKKQLLWIK